MSGLARDIRDGWRGLLHYRGFSAAAVLMLALGIGSSSAIFAALRAVVLELPFAEPSRVVTVRAGSEAGENRPVSRAQFEAWQQAAGIFESVSAYTLMSPVLTGTGAAVRLQAEAMTAGMFRVLGVQPALGRRFLDDEERVVVLSDAFWRSRFAGDPGALGRPIMLDGVPTTIVGVMPPGFDGPRSRPGDAWLPLDAARTADRSRPLSLSVVARLAPGVTPGAARSRLEAMPRADGDRTPWRVSIETAREDFLYKDALSSLSILSLAVALVLVMACVNVASLLIGRNVSRRRELAVRLAVGARPWHLMRQVAIESLMLSWLGALLGLLLASWVVSAMVPVIPRWFPRIAQIDVDWGVAAFATLAATATGLAVSIWPAVSAARQDLGAVMRSGDRGHTGGARRARTWLVVMEATLAMVGLTAAGMLVGSFNRLNPTSPGFEYADRTKFSVRFAGPRYQDGAVRAAAVDELAARLRAVPGVADVSSVTHLPLTGTTSVFPARVNGVETAGRQPNVHFRAALPNYLSSMGIPIVRGRDLTGADTARSQPVAVVNEALVARLLRGKDPLNAELAIDEPDGPVVRRIIGVVQNVRSAGQNLGASAEVFVPYAQSPLLLATFVVRSGAGASGIEAGIHRVVGGFDPQLPVDRVETLRAVVERSVSTSRFFALLMSGFAVVAVVLAFTGLYSVAAWSVTQRTREIGVRLALGATTGDISRLVLRYGAAVGATAAAVGSLCSMASSKLIESHLYGFPAWQPTLLAGLAVAFALIVTVAAYLPARRAMQVDPVRALRAD